MFDKPHAKQTFGLELEGTLLKGVRLVLVKGKPVLERSYEVISDATRGEENQQLLGAAKKSLAVTALESGEVLIRTIDVKLKKERDIDSVLAFQAEPLLPYPIENAILDRSVLGQTQEGTQVAIIAARKDHVKQHLERWQQIGIDPDVVTSVPTALAFFSKLAAPGTDPHFVVHLGKRQTTCALVKEGKLLAAQTSPQGLEALLKTIPENAAEVNFTNIVPRDNPALDNALDEWRRDITRLLFALSKQVREFEVSDVLITGEGAPYRNLGSALCRETNKQILIPEPNPNFQMPIEQFQRYAVPIGAALSALENVTDQINFRQNDFAHSQPWKHLVKPVALYFLLCATLAGAFYLFGKSNISHQENHIRQQYVDLLATMNKSYPDFEKEYQGKQNADAIEEMKSIENLTPADVAQRLQKLQKDLKESPDTFPLFPNTPRVSDLLAWLSTHSNVVGPNKDSQLIQIESINYSMVKRPELKKKQEKYQVKVELEFSTSTPKLAREFHDALIAPNDIVDPKGEVKWSSNRGKYRASFFLKDKTMYPSSSGPEG